VVHDSVDFQIGRSSTLVTRKSTVIAKSIKGYKTVIETATDDLYASLESINEKLERVLGRRTPNSSSGSIELN